MLAGSIPGLTPPPLTNRLLYDEYVTVSNDAGLSFSPNQRMSEVTAELEYRWL